MNINEKIIQHLNQYNDYDIRQTKDAKYFDHKITPDVVMTVADSVLNFIANDMTKEFSSSDIRSSDYSNNFIRLMYSKPATTNPNAAREYDKFFSQPLQMLAHSHVLSAKKQGGTWFYKVNNYELLEYVATKDFFAFNFLSIYIERVLTESGFMRHFLDYKDKCRIGTQSKDDYIELRDRWDIFLTGNTNVKSIKNSRRIWLKVFNALAVKHQTPGTARSTITGHIYNFSDLLYNRINWRDQGRDRRLTRSEAAQAQVQRFEASEDYRIQKAIRIIQAKYSMSELNDQFVNGIATCVHHIFPKHAHPQIAAYLENLIKLTVQQHMEKAHPNHNTGQTDRNYQLDCLIAKSQSIENSLDGGEFIYSLNDFIFVINTGLSTEWPQNLDFELIRSRLIEHWSMSA